MDARPLKFYFFLIHYKDQFRVYTGKIQKYKFEIKDKNLKKIKSIDSANER
jgi:hypothetical protein